MTIQIFEIIEKDKFNSISILDDLTTSQIEIFTKASFYIFNNKTYQHCKELLTYNYDQNILLIFVKPVS